MLSKLRARRPTGAPLALMVFILSALACRAGGPPPLLFSPDQLPPAVLGQPYSATISITNNATPVGQMTTQALKLPPGLAFTFQKGQNAAQVAGTPTQAGTFKVTVSAWCFGTNVSGQAGSHDYQLVVQ